MRISASTLFVAAGLAAAALPTLPTLPAQTGIQLTTGVDGGYEWAYSPLFVPRSGITVEAWITYDDSTITPGLNYWPTIARQNVTPNQESWNFRVSAGSTASRNLQFIVRKPNNALYAATYAFAPGEFVQFTHVAATYDGRTITLFKNGTQVAVATTPTTDPLVDQGGVLRVGNGDPIVPGFESWNGVLDELRIWPMARTAAEILATRDLELGSMPGDVLTMPLDFPIETGHGLIGTQFGTVTLAPGATLATTSSQANVVGAHTSTCTRTIQALLGSPAIVGNQAFTIWCIGGPLPAAAPLGVLVAGAAPAPAGQPPVLGVQFAFDVTTLLAQVLLIPPTDALGNSRRPLPLPNTPGLVGTSLIFQFGYFDAACGPQGFTGSSGIQFTTQ